MTENNYNRQDTWKDLYEKHHEDPNTSRSPIENGSFAELFESRGMLGFKPKEKDLKVVNDRPKNRYPQSPQDVLDLHGLTVDEATKAIDKFVIECRERGLIFVLIITGKGANSAGGSSKLRPLTVQILNTMIDGLLIRDYKIAEPRHGGLGAKYVYLK